MPGAVVLVRDHGRTRIAAAGRADLVSGRAVTTNSTFRVGSITKSFVAALVVKLAQDGRLRLDDPVARWLPGRVPNGDSITIRQLLRHTSGLFDYSTDPRLFDAMFRPTARRFTPLELLAIGTSHPPLFSPGTRWSYSSTNYIALGLVLQAAAKMPVEQLLQRQIVRPLKLSRTSLPKTAAMPAPFARGYLLPGAPGNPTGAPFDTTAVGATWSWAAGGIVSSARDVARFYAALLQGRVVPNRLLAQMTATVPAEDGGYGLGLKRARLGCGDAWGHNGSVPGYSTYVLQTRHADRQLVVLVNGVPGSSAQRAAVDSIVAAAFCALR